MKLSFLKKDRLLELCLRKNCLVSVNFRLYVLFGKLNARNMSKVEVKKTRMESKRLSKTWRKLNLDKF